MNKLRRAIISARTGLEIAADGELTGEFFFPESFVGFAGHFPGHPLVPAVVQVLIAQTLIEERCGAPLRLTEFEGAKFFEQLRPLMPITVVCRERRPLPTARWQVQLSAGGRPVAAFRLGLCEEG
jgi:3-hydroxyacyl-[acyl-carrier-protein] dehydratase